LRAQKNQNRTGKEKKRKTKKWFLLATIQSLTSCGNPSTIPLQEACSGYLTAAWDSKSCSKKLPVILKIVPKATVNVHWRILTSDRNWN
jgi:hypothetical protein